MCGSSFNPVGVDVYVKGCNEEKKSVSYEEEVMEGYLIEENVEDEEEKEFSEDDLSRGGGSG